MKFSALFCLFSPIQYGYHVSRIPYADYRVNQLIPIFDKMKKNASEPKSRVLRKRYGVKLEFHQAGMLGLCHYFFASNSTGVYG